LENFSFGTHAAHSTLKTNGLYGIDRLFRSRQNEHDEKEESH